MLVSERFRELRGSVLYHYTHSDNREAIINSGRILHSRRKLLQEGITPEFITDEISRSIDESRGYDEYIFLVFSESHPFIYKNIQKGVPLIRAKIDVSILDREGVLIADRVATDSLVQFFTPEEALDNLQYLSYCKDERCEREIWDIVKKYEILVLDSIDLDEFKIKR